MDFYYNYFEDDCWENAGFSLKRGHVWSEKIGWREFHWFVVAALTDAPAYVPRVVSDVYEVDFWELWEKVKDVAKRKGMLYQMEIPQETISVSTMDFFRVTSDDMILFWGDDENIRFSQELKNWFDDPVMEEAGSVVFVPEGSEYEHVGLHYFGTPPRRRLKACWDMIKEEERNNKARVTFRRYMALLANKKLWKEVFGF